MIARYRPGEMRIFLCGLTVFVLALAFSLWDDGRHDKAPVTRIAPQPLKRSLVPTEAAPLLLSVPPPAATSTTSAAPAPAVSAVNRSPGAALDVDDEATLARRDRGTERSSRSR
jgi:hypothetical protein